MSLAAVRHLAESRPAQVPGLCSVQGTLALEVGPRLDPPHPPVNSSPRPGDVSRDRVPVDPALRRDTEHWVARYLQAAVEIVQGDRPPHQLARHTDPDVQRDVVRRCALVSTAAGREAAGGRTPGPTRPAVLAVHTTHVQAGAVEAFARVRHGARQRAVAARFELRRSHWVCVALEFA